MRTISLILLFGFFSSICMAQAGAEVTEKRNIYNTKGNYYFDRQEFRKAILYYNLAYQKDTTDYFSVLKKAEAYTKLKLYPQAEECYRIVFGTKLRVANIYRLKYAQALLANNKTDEFKHWLGLYMDVVNEEIKGENYLISTEKRIQLYKDTAVVLVSDNQVPDTIKYKIRYEGYQFKRRTTQEDNKIYLILNNGDEYSIDASPNDDFNFSFQPMEDYRLILQQENIRADNILNDPRLTPEQRKRKFLKPAPVQKDELLLETGMKYQFSSGKYTISPQYLNTLKQLAGTYHSQDANTVDLTALVKELELAQGEVYTIRFARVEDPDAPYKKMEISTVTMNDRTINIYGQSFLVLLPDRAQENFAIQTDIEELEKNFNPKKYSLVVDDGPLFRSNKELTKEGLISLTVNTNKAEEVVGENRVSADEISIIPGTEYLLTLSKPDPGTGENIEVIVPLTRGVRYNLTSELKPAAEYKEALAEFLMGRKQVKVADEEVIDISILSKELEVQPGEELSFTLMPVRMPGKQTTGAETSKSNLTVDEKVFEMTPGEKYLINVPFNINRKVNLQTDLDYLLANFNDDSYNLRLDTIPFTDEITVDTAGFGALKSTGWLSMNVNTESAGEVARQDQFTAKDVSIIPGTEYILTVSKTDAMTKKKEEIIIPLLRQVKYDFTSNPMSEEAYKESLEEFLARRDDLQTTDGTLIDITLLSKELQIRENDEVSFSLLPVRMPTEKPSREIPEKSSLYLDNKVVEFTYIHKYTINIPLSDEGQMNVQTNLDYIEENFDPAAITVNVDTLSFFSEIEIDTAGLGERVLREEVVIKDPVFDVIIINFDLNQYALTPEAREKIKKEVIDVLQGDSRLYVTIKGYTDALGDAAYNLNLSKRRAESVKEYLKNNGIGESRIRTFSFGEEQALKEGEQWENLDEEELRKHRKVEIVIYLPK